MDNCGINKESTRKRQVNSNFMNDSEKKLLDEILLVLKKHPDFDPPFFRTDGDLVIPLNNSLKKNREAHKRFANAFRSLINII